MTTTTTTTLYPPGSLMDDQRAVLANKFKGKPESLSLASFDPQELSKMLSVVVTEPDHVSETEKSSSASRPSQEELKPVPAKSNRHSRLFGGKSNKSQSSSKPTSRRGSLFDRFTIKGANYEPEKDESTPNFRYVPKNAAAQFASTTTARPLNTPTQSNTTSTTMKPIPGHNSLNHGTMTLQDYNKLARRAHMLCSGRSGPNPLTVLETTAEEVDEEGDQRNVRHSFQPHHYSKGFDVFGDPDDHRRGSTGIMRRGTVEGHTLNSRKASAQSLRVPKPDSARGSFSSAVSRRRDSDSSSRNDGQDSSAPSSPLKHEFVRSDLRRGSDNSSRRGSFINIGRASVMSMRRVDCTQGDALRPRRDSKFSSFSGRLGGERKNSKSESDSTATTVDGTSTPSDDAPQSPAKSSFLRSLRCY